MRYADWCDDLKGPFIQQDFHCSYPVHFVNITRVSYQQILIDHHARCQHQFVKSTTVISKDRMRGVYELDQRVFSTQCPIENFQPNMWKPIQLGWIGKLCLYICSMLCKKNWISMNYLKNLFNKLLIHIICLNHIQTFPIHQNYSQNTKINHTTKFK